MSEPKGRVIPVAIEDEVKNSYLTYAMSVIVSRALPDVRDGLKPVHRRILYAMSEMGLRNDRPYKKCGRLVGDVLGKFHPHGDQSIYDALVRLAQDFSLRYPVVQGQGNFGSVDGDPPAAMRYTESRMAKLTESILRDIKKETVDFQPNYDDSMEEPTVLPTAFPFLLVNGGTGIAVGMATNMAPHNLIEVCNAIKATIDNPEITINELLEYVKGPDFPTAGIIHGKTGIRYAAKTGRGKIVVRARYEIEEIRPGKDAIIVTELPYQVNKANLIIKIADLVKDRRVEGISDLRDESDRNGMRMVIELKKSSSPKVIMNQLFSHTSLQINFNVNNLALVDGKPKLCNLKDLIHYFILHRKDVITRRTIFDLKKAKEKEHILKGLYIALQNIDEVIEIIKSSENVSTARERLMERFILSELQAQAILDMRLQKITSLETKKIVEDLEAVRKLIAYLEDLLANIDKLMDVIKEETTEISQKYGDERQTEIVLDEVIDFNMEDMIEKEDMVVLLSNKGFIKRIPLSAYKEQARGGKGSSSVKLKDGDFIEHIFIASTHDYIMFVTSFGKAYWLKVYEIPEGTRHSKGKHLKTIFEFEEEEEITTYVPIQEFSEDKNLFMVTKYGVIKRVSLYAFRNARMKGIRAIDLDENDCLIKAEITDGSQNIVLVSSMGKGLRFHEDQVRVMGRTSHGVRGLRLQKDDYIVGLCLLNEGSKMFLISENGYGKRTEFEELNPHGRGTQGQKVYNVTEKTSKLISAMSVQDEDSVVCINAVGRTIKVSLSSVSVMGRNAFGVRIIKVAEDKLVGIAKAANTEENEDDIEVESENNE